MRILIHNGLWLGIFVLLSACGQKGDLYLPQTQPATSPQTSPPAPAQTATPTPKEST